jgi:hypothetical protein
MEVRVGFEPTGLGICSPLHWATLPPHCCTGGSQRNRTSTRGFGDRCSATKLATQLLGAPDEIRTRVPAVKGRCPRPLDDGSLCLAVCMGLEPMVSAVTVL